MNKKRTPQEIYDYESKRIDEYEQRLEQLFEEITKLFKWYGNAKSIKSKAYQDLKKDE